MDLIDDEPQGNAPEFTVSELSGAVKRVIEGEFGFVRVRGEIGRVSLPRSGHVYLDLKDDRSVIAGVIWKGVAGKLSTKPEEGMEVIATGRLTTFPGQSKYQIIVEDLQPAGQGALMAMLEKRKAKLAAEGLFAEERKKPLPFLPKVIGVVTSPSGAVIRDILHRLRDRFPREVLIWPVAVQGEKCASEVAAAIQGFNELPKVDGHVPRPDLLIVARGGGSVEDLWGFNEEIVVRAAAASEIPLISAVGHETDTTLIDFVADRRAPTPTAAAEMAVPVRAELLAWTNEMSSRLTRASTHATAKRSQRLQDISRALGRPESILAVPRQRFDRAAEKLPAALDTRIQSGRLRMAKSLLRPETLERFLSNEKTRLADRFTRLTPALNRAIRDYSNALTPLAARLSPNPLKTETKRKTESLDQLNTRMLRIGHFRIKEWRDKLDGLERLRLTLGYEATLERGYTVAWSKDRVITTKEAAEKAEGLEIQFQDGRLEIAKDSSLSRSSKQAKPSKTSPKQGSLF